MLLKWCYRRNIIIIITTHNYANRVNRELKTITDLQRIRSSQLQVCIFFLSVHVASSATMRYCFYDCNVKCSVEIK